MLSPVGRFEAYEVPVKQFSALNDLTGPSAGPLARTTYSYSSSSESEDFSFQEKVDKHFGRIRDSLFLL